MLPICYICLRNDVKFRILGTQSQDLISYYDQLCDNKFKEFVYQFCPECISKLKKGLEFKNRCKLASNVIKSWMLTSESDKVSLNELYKHMPSPLSQLSPCNGKNFKVYENDQIIIFEYDSTDETSVTENDTTQEICLENDTTEKVGFTQNDITIENDNLGETNEIDINNEESINRDSDSDASMKELRQKIKKRKEFLLLQRKNKMLSPKKKFDIEELKCQFKNKFEKHGEVRDDKGNVIDPNIVLNNLDKYSDLNLSVLKKDCLAPGPFEPNAIRRLSLIQDRFKEYETMFEITFLSDQKQMKEEFENRKNYPCYTEREHRCEKCIMGFGHAKILKNHLKNKHDESLPYSCTLCQCFFTSVNRVQKHVMMYHAMVYKCKQCPNFITNFRQVMKSHYSRHMGRVNVCNICGKQYRSVSSYYVHVNTAHPTNHICQLCATAFRSALGLNNHTKRKHEGEEFIKSPQNTKCEVCNIVFINNDVYNTHCNKQHSDVARRERKRRNSKTAGNTENHQRVINCPLCGKTGPRKGWMYQHYLSDHPGEPYDEFFTKTRKHLCELCGRRFINATALKEHKYLHTGEKPFICDICPAKFHRKRLLFIHLETHQPRRHECKHCGKMFATAANLYLHMRIHVGDRRFKCDLCGKGFLHNVSLREHIRGVHEHIKRDRKRTTVKKPK